MLISSLKLSARPIVNNHFCGLIRNTSSSVSEQINYNVNTLITNRNPRNLERLTIARKPTGFHLDVKGKEFWYRLEIVKKSKYVVGQVVHNTGKVVISASSNELGVGKHLYRTKDISAYINVGRVLAQRCLESGIDSMSSFIDENSSGDKVKAFIKEMEKEGILLSESRQYKPLTPWSLEVMKKSWKIQV